MTRIFLSLGLFSIALLGVTLVLGLGVGGLSVAADEATWVRFRMHFMMGVASALVVVLVNSIGVTYFIGTSRWCKEVVQTYALDSRFVRESTRLKRRTFPWALVGMLTIVGVIAVGAASDPGTGGQNTAEWRQVHFVASLAGTALIGWSFFVQWMNIHANSEVIDRVMAEVRRIRQERGLDL